MIGMKLVIGLLIVSGLYVLQLYFNKSTSLKIIVITTMFALSSLTYFSFDSYKGWPTKEKIRTGYLLDVQVIAPSQNNQGAIYLWVIDESTEQNWLTKFMTYTFEFQPAPRSYYIPYSKEAEKKMNSAKKKIRDGFLVKIDGKSSDADGVNGKKKTSSKDGNGGDAENYDVPQLQIISPDNLMKKSEGN